MSQVSSSPVFSATRDESLFDPAGNRETMSAPGLGAPPVSTKSPSGTLFDLPVGRSTFHHEEPLGRDPLEPSNYARRGGMYQSYATVYKSYDARDNFEPENYDEDLIPVLPRFNESINNPYYETGETVLDVKFTEDRLGVPPFMKLKLWQQEGVPKAGLRGHVILENKTGLNLTFLVKASSPLLYVKETVDWLLPHETFKIHMKTQASYSKIANEFILVYAYPIYFRDQLDMAKLRDFWDALGSDLNPMEHVECHRIPRLLLCPELQGEYSILDFIGATCRGWMSGPPLVQLSSAMDIHEYPGYCRFWTPKEKDMEAAITCQLREKKRAVRREIQNHGNVKQKWNKVVSMICLAIAMLVFLSLDETTWQTLDSKVQDIVIVPVPSTFTIFTRPTPKIMEKIPEIPLPETQEVEWVMLDGNWQAFLIARDIWTKVIDVLSFQ